MLLGVSRQSVSKWEAERAYPEMDKLLRMCALFDCTLDELVCGDLTARPSDGTARVPAGKPQDVTGYDQAMRTFAWKLPLGIAVVMLGAALALLLSDPALVPVPEVRNLATVTVFVGAAVGLALVLPASFESSAFREEHPFVDDFYTADQRSRARSLMTTGLVAGAVLLMAGLAATIVLQADVWLAGAAFLVCAAAGAFVVVRGCLLGSRCNLARYNRRSLGGMSEEQIAAMGDDDLAARAALTRRSCARRRRSASCWRSRPPRLSSCWRGPSAASCALRSGRCEQRGATAKAPGAPISKPLVQRAETRRKMLRPGQCCQNQRRSNGSCRRAHARHRFRA